MKTPNRDQFGSTLRDCRVQAGLTQEQLALEVGLESGSMISRYEKGKNLPFRNGLEQIIRVLRDKGISEESLDELNQYSGHAEVRDHSP